MKLLIIPLSEEEWKKPHVAHAVEDIMICCRRISKKVDLVTERRRFAKASTLIEDFALDNMRKGNTAYLELDHEEAIALMRGLEKLYGTCTPSFIHPNRMDEFLNCVKLRKIAHFCGKKTGFVVIMHQFEKEVILSLIPAESHKKVIGSHIQPTREDKFFNDNTCCSNETLIKEIQKKLLEVINAERPFNASAYGHESITETLHTAIYSDQSLSPYHKLFTLPFSNRGGMRLLRISYDDGSEGGLFPLFSLKKLERRPACSGVIKLGIVSLRHSESLDMITDGYLIRNSEMNWQDSYGEQEGFAYQRMMVLLDSLLDLESSIEIHLYHTGLQPAVVGVYRAVVDQLKSHQGKVVIVPYFVRRGDSLTDVRYIPSKAWY